ncbi:MAG: AdeC/AdeK/OprM family multidrug efflux complex outer membrane factor [Verrucomicrobiota bacterium]|jgi:multidrug efflux system outer membrane protein
MSKYLSPIIALFILALAGCTLAPKYHRPPTAISPAWPLVPEESESQTNATAVPAADIGWREFFRDPRLRRLVELALTNNPDLRVAVLNVEQSRAQYRIQRAALFPEIDATGTGTRQRLPADLSGTGKPLTASQYSLSLGTTSYELDLFGRVRSLKAEALENYFATMEARRSAQIALVAEVGNAYLLERAVTGQLAVARQTLTAVRASYELIKSSYEAGVVSELDLRTAEGQVQTARSNVATYEQQLARAEDDLVLLVGRPLPKDLPPPQPLNSLDCLSDVPAGLPSDLLQRRPDILAAEHQLKAATASIGAARAAFFPTITLTASAGTASSQLDNLFAPGSGAWLFSPQITLPIFTAGRNLANLDVAKISKLIEVANYEKSIQTAFREVSDALAARATTAVQIDAGEALVNAEQRRYELAEARFRQGVDSYLNVLSAQQDLYTAQENLIQFQFSRLSNLINLYQALGGGWREYSPQQH